MTRRDPTSRSALGALVADLGYPAVRIAADRVVDGEAAWSARLGRLTPPERAEHLRGLGPVLLRATENGRARLTRWQDEYAPLPSTVTHEEIRALVRDHVLHVGDAVIGAIVVEALVRAPEPIRQHALDHVAFASVGIESAAWTTRARFADRTGRLRDRLVLLGPDTSPRLVLHEVAHTWHDAPVAPRPGGAAMTTQGEAALVAHFHEAGFPVDALVAQQERRCDACAYVWWAGAPW